MNKTIEIKNLKKYFGGVKAVDDVSISVHKGDVFGFLGPNGAGKTTTIRCMMDFIRPLSGTIDILGQDAHIHSTELKNKIGFLSSEVSFYESWTGREHLDFLKTSFGRVSKSAEDYVQDFEFDPTVQVKNLSTGNKQKLGILMAISHNPEILILDEPTRGLDPILQLKLYDILKDFQKNGCTIFMSSHNLSEVEHICDTVGIIKDGKMVRIETVQNLKDLKLHRISFNTIDTVAHTDLVGSGIEIVEETEHGAVLKVRGEIDPVLKKLHTYTVTDLEISHASLEEIFLEYYT